MERFFDKFLSSDHSSHGQRERNVLSRVHDRQRPRGPVPSRRPLAHPYSAGGPQPATLYTESYQPSYGPEDTERLSLVRRHSSTRASSHAQEQDQIGDVPIRYNINAKALVETVEQRHEEVKELTRANQELKCEVQNVEEKNQLLSRDLQNTKQDCQSLEIELQKADKSSRAIHEKLQTHQSDKEALNHSLQQSRKNYQSLERRYDDMQKKLNALDRQNTSSAVERDTLKRTEQTLNHKVRRLEQVRGSLESDLDVERCKVKELLERIKASENCIDDLEKELDRTKDAQQVYAEDVRKAQETAFQLIEQGQWMPEADRDITRKLNNLHTSMVNWCKNYAYKTAMNLRDLSGEDQARIKQILSQVAQQVDETDSAEPDDLGLGSKGPVTLLLAALAHAIYDTIFSNPFFLEGGRLSSAGCHPASHQEASAVLYKIYMDMCKSDMKGANIWRSQTLRLLDPQAGVNNPSREGRKGARNLRAAAAGRFSTDFIRGDARVFLDLGGERSFGELEGELTGIAIRAAELSYKLWTQRTQLSSLGIGRLPKTKGAVLFSSNSDYLEHHPLHNVQLHDDENSLDGKCVVLVTHPAVVAYGDAEGNDYSKRKVWKKAVVWMGS